MDKKTQPHSLDDLVAIYKYTIKVTNPQKGFQRNTLQNIFRKYEGNPLTNYHRYTFKINRWSGHVQLLKSIGILLYALFLWYLFVSFSANVDFAAKNSFEDPLRYATYQTYVILAEGILIPLIFLGCLLFVHYFKKVTKWNLPHRISFLSIVMILYTSILPIILLFSSRQNQFSPGSFAEIYIFNFTPLYVFTFTIGATWAPFPFFLRKILKHCQQISESGGVHLFAGWMVAILREKLPLPALCRAFVFFVDEVELWLLRLYGVKITNKEEIYAEFATNLTSGNLTPEKIEKVFPFEFFSSLLTSTQDTKMPGNPKSDLNSRQITQVLKTIQSLSGAVKPTIILPGERIRPLLTKIGSIASFIFGSLLPTIVSILTQ